jgi:S-adenosylmethionine synthetase
MPQIFVEHLQNKPVGQQMVELVERKGVGHPDSICDAIMEAVSIALSRTYIEQAGRVLHHNIDKGLLVAGQTTPALGGGTVNTPMRIIFGDRATVKWNGHHIDIEEIARATASRWLTDNLRFIDPAKHIIFQNEIQPGSPELLDIFERQSVGANDTSAAVGYAPLTETEQIVLATEQLLNSPDYKKRYPEAGEDVKVMGARQGQELSLTVALAFVDRFIPDEKSYFEIKAAISEDLHIHLQEELKELDMVAIDINTLDSPGRGLGGMYLTVLGTSAEGADGGQVGRGNRVNGVISLNRPMGTEAAAGKNPVCHVGKIYNVLTHQIAGHIYDSVEPVEEVYVWLCSQIGRPIDEPWIASAQVVLAPGASLVDVQPDIESIIGDELANISSFTERLARGELSVW